MCVAFDISIDRATGTGRPMKVRVCVFVPPILAPHCIVWYRRYNELYFTHTFGFGTLCTLHTIRCTAHTVDCIP